MSTRPVRTVGTAEQTRLRVRGVDHLALNTDDMAGTIAFYTEVLSLRLVAVARTEYAPNTGQPPHDNLRHYFFDLGNDSTIAFFEYPPGTPKSDRDGLAAMQHVAFHVARADFEVARERLRERGLPFVGPVDRPHRQSIYFYDNNGIRLEFTTSPADDDFETVDSLRMTRDEAARELATLYPDPTDLKRILDAMPLRD